MVTTRLPAPDAAPDGGLYADGCCTPRQAAAEFGLSRTKLYDLMGRGVLTFAVSETGRRLIPRASIRAYLASLPVVEGTY